MFHYFHWFSHLCNYKWCVTDYINLVAKFLNFLKDFTATLYKLIFFLLASAICHYAIACRKTEKILSKIKGVYWRGKKIFIRYERKTENGKNVTENRKRLVKQQIHLQHTKQPVPWLEPYLKLSPCYQIHQESAHS